MLSKGIPAGRGIMVPTRRSEWNHGYVSDHFGDSLLGRLEDPQGCFDLIRGRGLIIETELVKDGKTKG
jgi:4-aminobutyrate aminotransferase-like enzyme